MLEQEAVPLYVNKHEADGLKVVTGVSDSDMRKMDDGDTLETRRSDRSGFYTLPVTRREASAFLVGDRLVAGDTLFVQGCGRVDLPGSDPDQMYYSLTQKLAKLPPGDGALPGAQLRHDGNVDDRRRT